MTNDFGTRLQYVLRVKGMKQKELADLTGYTQVTISRYINNQRIPDILFIKRVVEELNIDAGFLLGTSEAFGFVAQRDDKIKRESTAVKRSAKYQIIRNRDKVTLYITDEAHSKVLDDVFLLNEDIFSARK